MSVCVWVGVRIRQTDRYFCYFPYFWYFLAVRAGFKRVLTFSGLEYFPRHFYVIFPIKPSASYPPGHAQSRLGGVNLNIT